MGLALSFNNRIRVQDEGTLVGTFPVMNFVGAGVTAANAGSGVVTVTIPGGISGITVKDEGVSIGAAFTALNFVGGNITAVDAGGGQANITVSVSDAWLYNGNTVGSEKYIGTNDNFAFAVYTNGLRRVTVANGAAGLGFVSINRTTASNMLDIETTTDLAANTGVIRIRNRGAGVSDFTEAGILFNVSSGNNPDLGTVGRIYMKYDTVDEGTGRITGMIKDAGGTMRDVYSIKGIPALGVGVDATGMGIGITTPAAKLHVYKTSGELIRMATGAVGDGYISWWDDVFELGRITIKRSDGNKMFFMNQAVEALRISGQNVGIGYSDGNTRLYVNNGTGLTYSFVVDGGGGNAITVLSSGDKVGIGTTAPETKLDVFGTGQMQRTGNATGGSQVINSNIFQFQAAYWTGAASSSKSIKVRNVMDSTTPAYHLSILNDADAELVSISDTQNVGIATATFQASMVGGVTLKNGTAPTGNVTDQFAFYSKDITAGNAAPHFRTEAGDICKIYKQTVTNSTGGAASGDLEDVTTAGLADPAKVNNNFTEIYAILSNLGLV